MFPSGSARNQNLGVYLQVYNLALDPASRKSSAAIEYVVLREDRLMLRVEGASERIAGAAQQLTLSKALSLASLEPGRYRLEVRITDRLGKRSITPSALFMIE